MLQPGCAQYIYPSQYMSLCQQVENSLAGISEVAPGAIGSSFQYIYFIKRQKPHQTGTTVQQTRNGTTSVLDRRPTTCPGLDMF